MTTGLKYIKLLVEDIHSTYSFVGQFNTQWHYAMASMVLAILPSVVIFILLQKYIVEGVVAGAVKG